jgi:pilus assembly protein CpaB
MRSVGLALLAFSLLFAGVAVWGLRSLSSAHAAAPRPAAVGHASVVVAARPIGFGQPLTADALKIQPWPQGAAPAGAFRSVAELTAGQTRVALSPIAADEPILPQKISGPGGRGTLSAVIRPGMRATTIRVDDVVGVAGFVLPGDFVDVLVTRGEGDNKVMRSDVVLEDVRVLAVDQSADDGRSKPVVARAATIEVTPRQAQKLALASQVGTLSLALRGQDDLIAKTTSERVPPVRVADLQVGGAPAAVRPHAARRGGPTVQIYRGAEMGRVSVHAE